MEQGEENGVEYGDENGIEQGEENGVEYGEENEMEQGEEKGVVYGGGWSSREEQRGCKKLELNNQNIHEMKNYDRQMF